MTVDREDEDRSDRSWPVSSDDQKVESIDRFSGETEVWEWGRPVECISITALDGKGISITALAASARGYKIWGGLPAYREANPNPRIPRPPVCVARAFKLAW